MYAGDRHTYAHSSRLVRYALRVGAILGLSREGLRTLHRGALLHDIGKLLVHERILAKPGPLSETEWRAMRRHPASGYRLVTATPIPDPVAEVVLTHHEWYDGTGYPLGLKRTAISLEARICALVDMLDALTSDRSYRQPVGFAEAAAEINDESGTHFDPLVVEAFLTVPVEDWARLRQAADSAPTAAWNGAAERFDKPKTKVLRFVRVQPPYRLDCDPHPMPGSVLRLDC